MVKAELNSKKDIEKTVDKGDLKTSVDDLNKFQKSLHGSQQHFFNLEVADLSE